VLPGARYAGPGEPAVNEFYGPFTGSRRAISLTVAAQQAGKTQSEPSRFGDEEWFVDKTIFMPLNNIREKTHRESVSGRQEEMPHACWICTHVVGTSGSVEVGGRHYSERRSTIGWPPAFDIYVERSYKHSRRADIFCITRMAALSRLANIAALTGIRVRDQNQRLEIMVAPKLKTDN